MRKVNGFTGSIKEPTDLQPERIQPVGSIDELMVKSLEILRREIQNLMIESSRGKLENASATALVNYIKLLGELKKKEQELLQEMSTEFLEKLSEGK